MFIEFARSGKRRVERMAASLIGRILRVSKWEFEDREVARGVDDCRNVSSEIAPARSKDL